MKRIFSISISLFVLTVLAAAQRLPESAVPENYNLTFITNFDKDNFAGDETISVRVLKPTSQIVLNSAEIEFQAATITSGGSSQTASVTLDKVKQFATLTVPNTIQPGPATIHILYTGILNGDLRGFYLGKEENGKKYAVTQFESTDARRAFPSFDEPAYKATADITVITDKDKVAISNREVVSDTPGPGPDQHTVKFAQTAKMSSYLYAIAVGDFEYIEGSADGIPIRVYTFPGRKEQGKFALEVAEYCIKFYDQYFGVKYAFTKLDLIGLPDFAAGAMENAGAITFREAAMLIDDQHASVDQKKNVAITITHEIAHQWFGDLVTMKWWDDVWLNEGFATWMESKPVEAWKPEWDVDLDDLLTTNQTMAVDSLASTRPIHQAAETPEQIQELFDGIAYGKAAAVLQMLEAYLGPETFRKGVDSYIKQHAYGNSTAEDFWSALTTASNKPVDQIMETFVKQAGLPVVSVKSECAGDSTKISLAQQRYFVDRSLLNAGSSELWKLPVCMKSTNGQNKCELLSKKEDEFTLPGCSQWVLANANASGYYHSFYTSDSVRSLSGAMQTALSPGERLRLIADEWAAVRVDRAPVGDFMVLAEGLKAEHNDVVLQQGALLIQTIGEDLVNGSDRPTYQQWVRNLFTPLAKELGWKPVDGESYDRKELRAIVMETLGYVGRDPQVLEEAGNEARAALQNPDAVDPSMASAVFQLAAINGDASLYEGIMAAMPKAKSPEEFYRLGFALTAFSDPTLVQRTLNASLTPVVRTQDAPYVIASVLRNYDSRSIAWDFVRAHWDQIDKMMIGFSAGTVIAATGSFCDAEQLSQLKSFFAEHPVPAAERTLKQSIERINLCVDLKKQQSPQVASWLDQHGGAAGK